MSRLERVFAHIEAKQGDYLQDLFHLIRHPGISARVEGLEASARATCQVLHKAGFDDVRILWGGDNPCVYGRINGPPHSPTLLIYGHHDVQPPEPLEEWLSPPFEPTLRDGRIYGRGAADAKGQWSCHVFALQAMVEVLGQLPLSGIMFIDGQEESAGPYLPQIVEENQHLLQADAMYTSDGPFDVSGRPVIYCGVRGYLAVELKLRTAARDLHSGHWGGLAPNPALHLMPLITALRDEKGVQQLPGFYDDVRPMGAREKAALSTIPFDPEQVKRSVGIQHFDEPRHRHPLENLMYQPAFNVAAFHAGYGGEGLAGSIPCEAVAKLDWHLVADQDAHKIFESLVDFVKEREPDCEVKRLGLFQPHRTDLDDPYIAQIGNAVNRIWGEAPIVYPSIGGGGPDAFFARPLGIPTVVVPYGNPDEQNHAPNENFRLDCWLRGMKTSASVFWELAHAAK